MLPCFIGFYAQCRWYIAQWQGKKYKLYGVGMAVLAYVLIHFGKIYFTVNTAIACNAIDMNETTDTWLFLANHWAYEILPFFIWCTAPIQGYMVYWWDHDHSGLEQMVWGMTIAWAGCQAMHLYAMVWLVWKVV